MLIVERGPAHPDWRSVGWMVGLPRRVHHVLDVLAGDPVAARGRAGWPAAYCYIGRSVDVRSSACARSQPAPRVMRRAFNRRGNGAAHAGSETGAGRTRRRSRQAPRGFTLDVAASEASMRAARRRRSRARSCRPSASPRSKKIGELVQAGESVDEAKASQRDPGEDRRGDRPPTARSDGPPAGARRSC